MSGMKRRQFLQFAGSALTTLGINQLYVMDQGDIYGRVLAQSTSRKIALLVGINEYAKSERFSTLQGCLTDLELQRQLLTYRFGFNPKDILTLTDAQANRQGILTAFEEHLIKQAKPGDVVVFHYSGHGSRVADPNPIRPDKLDGTFIPSDDTSSSASKVVPDIMGRTLFLLMSALQTENVTVVLDSCHSGSGTRGNIRVRAGRGGLDHQPSPAELDYQNKWLSKLNLSPQKFNELRSQGVAKGVVIASTQADEEAADAAIGDFFAGAFTYSMTQYLWQQTGSAVVETSVTNVGRTTSQISSRQNNKQNPLAEVKPGSNYQDKPIYFTNIQAPAAEAVVTRLEGDRATVWLGGLSADSLAAFQSGAIFTPVSSHGRGEGKKIELQSVRGLEGQVTIQGTLQLGTLLQEAVRVIPKDLKLRIGLDPSLGGSTNDALTALKGINRIEPVPEKSGDIPYQGEVQYIFGSMTPKLRQELQRQQVANLPEVGSLGLYSPALDVIPDSFGKSGETATDAIKRLAAKLRLLTAARLVKLTLNTTTSRLAVEVSMSRAGDNSQLIAQTFTARGIAKQAVQTPKFAATTASQKIPVGTSIQFHINNREAIPLYLSVLVIDPTGDMTVVFPNQWTASEDVTRLEAGQTLVVPEPNKDGFNFVTSPPKGVTEVLVIASKSSLTKALKALQSLAAEASKHRGPVTPTKPVEVVSAFLDDLEGNGGSRGLRVERQTQSMDTSQMATMSITFEIT